MTLSDIVGLQKDAEALHRLVCSEAILYSKAKKKNQATLKYRKGWYDKAERLRYKRAARAREALFAIL